MACYDNVRGYLMRAVQLHYKVYSTVQPQH